MSKDERDLSKSVSSTEHTPEIVHPSFQKDSQILSSGSIFPTNTEPNSFFNSPHFELSQQNERDLERSVSPFEIPNLTRNQFVNEDSNKTEFPSAPNSNFQKYIQEQIDLKIASSENPTVVLELDMDGNVRHLSKNWDFIVGTNRRKIVNRPISNIIIGNSPEDKMVFHSAIEQMISDDGTYKINFITATNDRPESAEIQSSHSSGKITPNDSISDLNEACENTLKLDKVIDDKTNKINEIESNNSDNDNDSDRSSLSTNGEIIQLEAQGILIHDPKTNLPTHSMWTIKPFLSVNLDLHLPTELIDLLGMGSEFFEGYLINLSEQGIINEDSVPQPRTVLCRICEQNIPVWFIEKHNELCLVEHKLNDELQECHDLISEQRQLITKISESYLYQQQLQYKQQQKLQKPANNNSNLVDSPTPNLSPSNMSPNSSTSSLSSSPAIITEYKDISLPSLTMIESSQPVISSLLNTKKFPLGILQRLIELCDEALQINLSEEVNNDHAGFITLSPNTHEAIKFVTNWKVFETNDLAIRTLVDDTQNLTKTKIETLNRLVSFLQYFKKINTEVDELVLKTVHQTVQKIKERTFSNQENTIDNDELDNSEEVKNEIFDDKMLDKKAALLHSPQPSRTRTPNTQRLLDESLDESSTSINSLRGNVSLTPQDFLKGRQPFDHCKKQNTSTKEGINHLAEYFGELDSSIKRRGRDLGSSFSSPRRHLSPAPYVERQSLSSFQKTNFETGKATPTTSPVNHAELHSESDNDNTIFVYSSEKNRSSSGGSSLVVPANFNGSGPSSSKTSINKPPLSPLLVSQTPVSKPSSGSIKDYDVLKAISKGAFGSVFLARKKLTGEYVAIKCLKKTDMVAKNQVLNVKSERAVMMKQTDSPYVAQLYSSFQTKDYLYLVMEYLPGGDVATLLKVLGTLGNQWSNRYIAEVIVGISDLHDRGIIHRDLKPDNLLIDSKGHLKLTDFGLSRMGVIGRQKRSHRKSSSSEQAIELFRKSVGPGSSPLVTVSMQNSTSNSVNSPSENHKRNSSVTPFSLSPSLDQVKPNFSSSPSAGNDPFYSRSSNSNMSHQRLARSSSTFSGGLESPILNPLLPRTNSDTSITQLDDDFSVSPSQNVIPTSYALYDPKGENNDVKKFVGTPDYLAPETIKGVGQSEVSDWWSVGCILFEFLFGYPPFHADTPLEVFANILECRIDWPALPEKEELEICPPEAKSLIKSLLVLNPEERLGYNGAQEIKDHIYFKGINWDSLFKEVPSFVPTPENPESTDYFDSRGADISQFPKEDEFENESFKNEQRSTNVHHINTNELGSPSISESPSVNSPGMTKRERRGSRLADATEFGSFNFRNLSVLEKANKDVINRLKTEHLEHRNSFSSSSSESPHGSRGQSITGTSSSPLNRPTSPQFVRSSSPNKRDTTKSSCNTVATAAAGVTGATSATGALTNISTNNNIAIAGSPLVPGSKNERVGSAASVYSSEVEFPFEYNKPQNSDKLYKMESETSGSNIGIGHKSSMSSLSKQVFKISDFSPGSSDTEDSKSSALLRIKKRRESARKPGSFSILDGKPLMCEVDILYCEPIPIVRHSITKLLERLGCIVVAVSDGDELIRRATSQVKFDIIFTALRLSRVEAPDAVKLIRYTSGINSKTPIIAITGFAKEAINANCFTEVLEKPIDSNRLRNCVTRNCNWSLKVDDEAIESDSEKI